MRICSLLPSATEIVYALGLGDHLVGVSHTCDYPEEARAKPVVSRSVRQLSHLSSREIDTATLEAKRDSHPDTSSLAELDELPTLEAPKQDE